MNKPIVVACTFLAISATSQGALTLYEDTFGAGNNSSTSVPGWNGGAYNGSTNTNPATQATSNPIVSGRGGVGQLTASFPGPPTNGSYAGTQLYDDLGASIFDGYAFSDITLSLDLSVLSDKTFSGTLGFINIEIREASNSSATKRFRPIPVDLSGTFQSYSFTLDQSINNAANPFGAGAKTLVIQVQDNYSDASGATTTILQFDNVKFSAVPEPSAALLGALAGLCLLRRKR